MYKIKHKKSGLFYQPNTGYKGNLGFIGKEYQTLRCPLTMGMSNYLDIMMYPECKCIDIFKKYFPNCLEEWGSYYIQIPKSEFELIFI